MISDIGHDTREDRDVRDGDKELKQKDYTDEKRNAKECDLVPEDKVHMKNVIKDNKLSTTFASVPLTVEKTNKGEIQVRNDKTGQ